MNDPEVRRQGTGDRGQEPGGTRPLLFTLLLAGLVGGTVLLAAGCRRPPTGQPTDPKGTAAGPKGDPWDAAAKKVRKDPQAVGVKAALAALNTDLANRTDGPKPPALAPEAVARLAELVPLSDGDKTEIRGGPFTPFDSAYVAECLYLRDAARSLDLAGLPPEQLADLAFEWTCRQAYLNPWLVRTPSGAGAAALPPAFVLRRGYGSALERMYVFLGLLQQMGLDGCLVGPADAGEVLGYKALGPDQKPLPGGPARPFWAVGVRTGTDKGADVRLYDPWRGKPFPATLNQLKADPDAHKAWFEDKANASGVSAGDAKAAAVFLAVPVSSLAPRLKFLEDKVRPELGVRLALDPAALRAAFAPFGPKFWNPPADRFAYGRAARTFLPVGEGGTDPGPPGAGLYWDNIRAQVPAGRQVLPAELLKFSGEIEDVEERVVNLAQNSYGVAFVTPPPTPREQLQRGQFQDAAVSLVRKQDVFRAGLERLRNNRDADRQIQEWAETAAKLYGDLGQARNAKDPEAIAVAQAAIDGHWRTPAVQLLMDKALSEVGQAEATFLLALCKHEQAEHAQARLDRAPAADPARQRKDAADAWAAASGEWKTYLAGPVNAQANMPGRADHARALAARAERLAAVPTKK